MSLCVYTCVAIKLCAQACVDIFSHLKFRSATEGLMGKEHNSQNAKHGAASIMLRFQKTKNLSTYLKVRGFTNHFDHFVKNLVLVNYSPNRS